jgi:LacI family purine nucleotide synthesis repressor
MSTKKPLPAKPPTLKDVAGALGMHKSTVSLALSGKGTIAPATRQRVLAVARELGYEPNLLAQRLAHGMGATTVCIYSGVLDVGLATEKILLVQKALGAQGVEAPIYTCSEPVADPSGQNAEAQAAQVRQVCRQRPRAIVCAAQRVHPAVFRELAAYQSAGGIVISYDTPVPLECDQVIFDREDNAYRGARHLLENGHRKIGVGMSAVTHPEAMRPNGGVSLAGNGDPQNYRMRGFLRALEEFGVPYRDEWFFRNATYEKGGAEMARQFLEMKDRPTAIAVVNDYVALAFMVEVMRAGVRIPDDLSLVGHDNQPIAAYCPVPLTSMTQPTERIAMAVVERLLARLSGDIPTDAPPETILIQGELIERESVRSPQG